MSIKGSRGFARGSAWVLAQLTIAVVMTACSGDSEVKDLTGPVTLTGQVKTVPEIQGEWSVATTVTTDHCGSKALPLPGKFIAAFDQAGSTLGGGVSTACGDPIGGLSGTVDFNNIVNVAFDQSLMVGASCTVTVHRAWTGTVNAVLGRITGNAKATLTAEGDCGTAYPCDITGTFTATRCSRGVCPLETCAP